MKIPALLVAVLILVALFAIRNNSHTDSASDNQTVDSSLVVEGAGSSGEISMQETAVGDRDASQEERRKEMQQAFLALQHLRLQLKSYANLLKSKTWGLELPAGEASNVTYKMRQAYAYLKNPPMQGAYFEVDEIQSEIRRVDAMLRELNEVEALIKLSRARED